MKAQQGQLSEIIMRQVMMGYDLDEGSANPTVISCGGIYIPHQGGQQRTIYHVINTPSESEPVKVVAGARPRNILREVMVKESMN